MKIRKIFLAILLITILMILSNKVYAIKYYKIDHTDRSDIILKAFSEWMDTFKSEDTPEERRITDYKWSGVGTSESNPEKIRATIEFTVTPFSKENTKWQYSEPEIIEDGKYDYVWQKENICFIEMTNVNGEYQVDYIGETPKGYDEFLEKFEQYKKDNPEQVQNNQIQGKETKEVLANQKIDMISNTIIIICSIVLISLLAIISIKIMKKRNKLNK